jgi:spore germination protein GerM
MENNEIIVDKNLKLVYCDNIIDNGKVYRALANQIEKRYFLDTPLDDIFTIQLIYNSSKCHETVAEYEFVYNEIYGMELDNINMDQTAIDNVVYKEGVCIVPDSNVISKELALRMYNKFKEVFGSR